MSIIETYGPRGSIFEYHHICKADILKEYGMEQVEEFNKEALKSYDDFFRVYDRDFDFRTQEEKDIAKFRKNNNRQKLTEEERLLLFWMR
ncbi:MAG TPA: hypothetical protein PKY81_07430 [bacterium]|nr:hypothetical protein [bacterium]HPN30772.1 hypothetical protein [bacterium]